MTLIKLFLLTICCLSFISGISQNVKPKFKKFEYIAYRPTVSENKKVARIEDYLSIDNEGNLRYVINRFEGSHYSNLSFKGSMSDTMYRIPDSLIAHLNMVFNGKGKLKDHMITDKMPGHFAGPLEFITYTSANNQTDNFIVVEAFLDQELKDILDQIWHLPFGKAFKKGEVYRNQHLEGQVIKYQNACKYVPAIEAPPSLKSLD
jgi:hypothetical protein